MKQNTLTREAAQIGMSENSWWKFWALKVDLNVDRWGQLQYQEVVSKVIEIGQQFPPNDKGLGWFPTYVLSHFSCKRTCYLPTKGLVVQASMLSPQEGHRY